MFAADMVHKGLSDDTKHDLFHAFIGWKKRKRPREPPSAAKVTTSKHQCSSECEWYTHKNINICNYGNIHFCDREVCDKQEMTGEYAVCSLTSRCYELPFIETTVEFTTRKTRSAEDGMDDFTRYVASQMYGDGCDDTEMTMDDAVSNVALMESKHDTTDDLSLSVAKQPQAIRKALRKELKDAKRLKQMEQFKRRELTSPTDLMRIPSACKQGESGPSSHMYTYRIALIALLRYQQTRADESRGYIARTRHNDELIAPALLAQLCRECEQVWNLLNKSPAWRFHSTKYTHKYHPVVVFYRMQTGYDITVQVHQYDNSTRQKREYRTYTIIKQHKFLQKSLPTRKDLKHVTTADGGMPWKTKDWTQHSKTFNDLMINFTDEQIVDALRYQM